ncbi:hypothetical protein C2845_PM15G20350 [Panicum miliaceum]|uniref:Bet v I/Major latex protein domain-containing protein n=1 Tax=Panicum miliaceum TaxID=4540 RepID=A0A3L6Q6J7_PANMI|nr:hypothetical protein C2845_PM15G20350 [Panicum miliaceum]
MKGSKSHELEADVPAAELWKIYGTLRFVELVHELLPQSYKEEFVRIDDGNRVKEAAVIEGDILNLGFTAYVTRFEIVEKGPGASVIRSTVEYEYDDGRPELEAAASTAPLAAAAERLVQYVKDQNTAQQASA